MNIRPVIAASVVLMAGTAFAGAQHTRSGSSAPRRANTAPAASSSPAATPAAPRQTTSIPPGWGLAPGPASTVNHPGGVPSNSSTVQPLTGVQPLIPTGTFASIGPRGRASQVVVIPVYVPYPVAGTIAGPSAGDVASPSADPNAGQVQQYATQNAEQAYAQPPALYSEQTAPVQEAEYPPITARSAPDTPGPADVSYTLLAFKDHSFFAVTDYWVENNRLSYVTNYGTPGSAALDQLDLSLTVKLNDDRGVTFELHGK
jgi:hypothetical protein